MSISSRLQCAVIAVALVPYWATAQSSPLGGANSDVTGAGSQLSAERVAVPVVTDVAARPGDAGTGAAIPLPPANLETDPMPSPASTEAGSAEPTDEQAAPGGPTASSATAGIHSHAATEDLTRQQLADRASNRDQEERRGGIGRDAALMIVGGAAIITGAIIGGPAGTAFIVVGAAIGITGLVLILR